MVLEKGNVRYVDVKMEREVKNAIEEASEMKVHYMCVCENVIQSPLLCILFIFVIKIT